MNGKQFDALTRFVAARSTRRRLLRVLGGALAAGLTGGGGAAADGCKGTGKACSRTNQCCSGNCAPSPGKTSVARSGSICCPVDQVNAGGACVAPPCDACTGSQGTCASGCNCATDVDGSSVCWQRGVGNCFACASDADCANAFGPGEACVQAPECCPGTGGTGCVPLCLPSALRPKALRAPLIAAGSVPDRATGSSARD